MQPLMKASLKTVFSRRASRGKLSLCRCWLLVMGLNLSVKILVAPLVASDATPLWCCADMAQERWRTHKLETAPCLHTSEACMLCCRTSGMRHMSVCCVALLGADLIGWSDYWQHVAFDIITSLPICSARIHLDTGYNALLVMRWAAMLSTSTWQCTATHQGECLSVCLFALWSCGKHVHPRTGHQLAQIAKCRLILVSPRQTMLMTRH